MSKKLDRTLKTLRDLLQDEASPHCVSVSLFFNSEGYEIEYITRSPGSLTRDGISMRNLKGDYIQQIP